MAQHALLSPSAAHRWLHCTAAPRLEEHEADRGSSYAEEGTLAHAYCARLLKRELGASTAAEDEEIALLESRYRTGEMDECTEAYRTLVLGRWYAAREKTPDAKLLVETRLDFGKWVPDAFGTADAIIVSDGSMEVIDFKYGKGVRVSAVDNPQMMIYALGALSLYSFDYGIERVRMTIVQPRMDNLSEWEMTTQELLRWADGELRPKAREAFAGGGVQKPGEWCRFCKVRGKCRAMAETAQRAVHYDPRLMSPDEIAAVVLPLAATVKAWLTGVEEHTLAAALGGERFPGYKLVEGRSVRKITDPEAVMGALSACSYAPETYMKPPELRTITELEKLIGKKRFGELCGAWIEKPKGKPALVPETDKRPAMNPAADDFEGIMEK